MYCWTCSSGIYALLSFTGMGRGAWWWSGCCTWGDSAVSCCECSCWRLWFPAGACWGPPAWPQCVPTVPHALLLLSGLLPEPGPRNACLCAPHLHPGGDARWVSSGSPLPTHSPRKFYYVSAESVGNPHNMCSATKPKSRTFFPLFIWM